MPRRFKSYRLSRLAEGDLADIYDYTAQQWSVSQADRYILDIRTAITGLVEGDHVGRRRPDVPESYLAYLVGSHVIIYRETDLLLVVRILHASMDPLRHLK